MSTIPLPALGIHTEQPESALQQYGKVMSLKSLMQGQQLQQEQLKGAQQENQQRQISLDSQNAITKAYHEANGNPEQTVKLASQYGAKPQDVMALQGGFVEQRTKFAAMNKAQQDNARAQAEAIGQNAQAVLAAPAPQRRQALQESVTKLAQAGAIPPEQAQQVIQQAGQLDDAGLEKFLKTYSAGSMTTVQQLDEIRKEQESQDKRPGVLAESEMKQTEAANMKQFGVISGPAADARYRFILGKRGNATPEEVNWARSYEAANSKTTSTSDTLGIKSTSTSGPSGLSKVGMAGGGGNGGGGIVNSGGASTLIDEIGTGKMPANRLDMLLTKRPELLQAVAAKYPDFDGSKVKSYGEAYRSFTSGADSKQINAGGVAIQHLAELKKLNDDHTTAVRIPGTDAYNRFHNLLDTVADELVTFYGEPKTNEAMAAKKATLGAFLNRTGAIEEQAKAMGVKFDEMEQKWLNAAPSSSYQAPMPGMSKKAMDARAALDSEYAAGRKASVAPQSPAINPAVPVSAVGPNGHKIVVKNGKWVDAQTGAPI